MNYLKDYREGEKFVGTYLCKQKQILKTKDRKKREPQTEKFGS